jgi:hypothetical protein
MIAPCCQMMKLYGRDFYKDVPEADLPDAIIEVDNERGVAMLQTQPGFFDLAIQYCPWCGARITGNRSD